MHFVDKIVVDREFQLLSFQTRAQIGGMVTTAKGRRDRGGLVVEYNVVANGLVWARGKKQMKDFPKDMTFADEMIPYQGGGGLWEGKRWKIKILRPGIPTDDSSLLADAFCVVSDQEPLVWKEKKVDVYRVEIKWVPDPEGDRVPDYTLYVDEEGRVLKQEMKFLEHALETVLDEDRILTDEQAEKVKNLFRTRR